MNDPLGKARQLQLAACVTEVLGAGPAPDLAERIRLAASLDGAAPAAVPLARRVPWLAALVMLGGTAAVLGALWLREPEPVPALAPMQDQEPANGPENEQDPEPQGPAQDPELQKRIEKLLRDIESVERREVALAELEALGTAAQPAIERAIAAEAGRGREEMFHLLQALHARCSIGAAKAKFGLPPGPVTVFADYSDNVVRAVDAAGKTVWRLDEIFGAWDAELTPAGTMLVTEFSLSRVREVDGKGKTLWEFTGLKNPYDADRLLNGNTLICDTFGGRVIEVTPQKQVVWEFANNVRPFDAERLPNGNTLIADVLTDRVFEVNRAGEIVWKLDNQKNVHDVDRLPNGNTLVVLRSKNSVVEFDRDGKIVLEIKGLLSPSDADRLPNGHTIVAENAQVREFDRDGKQVWRKGATWAVEVQRY